MKKKVMVPFMFCALYKFEIWIQMPKKVEIDEGESDGPLDKPSLLSLQNTAIKVRGAFLNLH